MTLTVLLPLLACPPNISHRADLRSQDSPYYNSAVPTAF